MSERRHGRREMLEATLEQGVKDGKPVDELRAIERELEECEATTRRRDHADEMERVPNDDCPTPGDDPYFEPQEREHARAEWLGIISMFRSMLAKITEASRPRLTCECCEVALGFKVGDCHASMRDIATRNGVTVEAVSKSVEGVRTQFNLPAVEQNKSAEAVGRYKLSNGRSKA